MFLFKVMPEDDEPYELAATSRDVLQWERRNRGANMGALRDRMMMSDLYKIAYLAAVRQDRFTGSEGDFIDTVDLDLLDDDDELSEEDPTRAAA